MNGLGFVRLILWECRRMSRQRSVWMVLLSLSFAGSLALDLGAKFWRIQKAEIERLPSQFEMQMKRLSVRYDQGGEAGLWAYYTALPAWQDPHPLSALTWGIRDVVPMVTWVRLLGLEPQLYDSPTGNPRIQALGNFDLAFVLGLLTPCAFLLISHDVLSRDRSNGSLAYLAMGSGGLAAVLAARISAALLVVMAHTTMLALASMLWPGLEITWGWEAFRWWWGACLHLLFWAGMVSLIACFAHSPASSLALAFGSWVFFVILLPALMNLVLSARLPVPEGLELALRQRQAMHRTWDQPRQPNFEQFLRIHPEWSHRKQVPEEFSWTWYYAMHELADRSVAELANAYVQQLRKRRLWIERMSWLCPPALLQLRQSVIARTELEWHLLHLQRVRDYHQELKLHFFPLLTTDRILFPKETLAFPRFTDFRPPALPLPNSLPLFLLPCLFLPWIRPNRLLGN